MVSPRTGKAKARAAARRVSLAIWVIFMIVWNCGSSRLNGRAPRCKHGIRRCFIPRFLARPPRGCYLVVMTDPLDFTGKVVLVTGSSRGIGAAMIEAFGARGGQCAVNFVADPNGQNKADARAVAS